MNFSRGRLMLEASRAIRTTTKDASPPELDTSISSHVESWVQRSPKKRKKLSSEQKREIEMKKHPMLPRCSCMSKLCNDSTISHTRRKEIHKTFWIAPVHTRRSFIREHVKATAVKRRRTQHNAKKRNSTFEYYISSENGEQTRICKLFFMKTLGYRNDGFIMQTLKQNTFKMDRRGRHSPAHKLPEATQEAMKTHILSFNPQVSHYRRVHSPRRFYLPSDITIKMMFEDYLDKYPDRKVGYCTYQQKIQRMNISFSKLSGENCDSCVFYQNHIHNTSENGQCSICKEWKHHVESYRESRAEYETDREKGNTNEEIFVSVDMQKVFMLPSLPGHEKRSAFVHRLACYNETFSPLGGGTPYFKNICVLWHAGITGRDASDIASTYTIALKQYRNAKHIVFWEDNCSAQNKNWTLWTAICTLINSKEVPQESITFKFLEAGHTFMGADAVHASIERKIKKSGGIEDFRDWIDVISGCQTNVSVQALTYNHIYLWRKGLTTGKATENLPQLAKVKIFQFRRGSTNIFWKSKFHDEIWEFGNFLQRNAEPIARNGALDKVHMRTCDRGIAQYRKTEIIQRLAPLFNKTDRLSFWQNMSVADEEVEED